MGKTFIIDDADPTAGIVYNGKWQSLAMVSPQTEEYGSSVHKSGGPGDTIEYTFEGVGISVYGTVDTPGSKGLPDASFVVDNSTPSPFNNTGDAPLRPNKVTSHMLYYQSELLSQGKHTIKITNNGVAPFYFDFFVVDSGRDDFTPMSGWPNLIVDDRDLGIQYAGTWKADGVKAEYLKTTHQSPPKSTGGNASFSFMGSMITVYGTTDSNRFDGIPTKMLFFLDDEDTPTVFDGIPNTDPTFHIPVFTRTGLTNRAHTLVMVPGNESSFFLDYLVYGFHNVTSDGSITTSTNSNNGGGGTGQSVGSGTTAGSNSNGHEPPSIPLIIGGVIVGIIVSIILGLVGIYCWKKRGERIQRKRFSHTRIEDDPDELRMLEPRPFMSAGQPPPPPPPASAPLASSPLPPPPTRTRRPGSTSKHGFGTVRWNMEFDDSRPPEASEYRTPTEYVPQNQFAGTPGVGASTPTRETESPEEAQRYANGDIGVHGVTETYNPAAERFYSNERAAYGDPFQQPPSPAVAPTTSGGGGGGLQPTTTLGNHRPSPSVATTSVMTASTIALTQLTGSGSEYDNPKYREAQEEGQEEGQEQDSGIRTRYTLPPPRYTPN
ncbi:hypothetical protein FRB91_010290 [Serendipita sp. 411]|nr:hypothetical protein FRB91_010290 [Serendipita sp. 411]